MDSKTIQVRQVMGTMADFLHRHPSIKERLWSLPDGPQKRNFRNWIEEIYRDWDFREK